MNLLQRSRKDLKVNKAKGLTKSREEETCMESHLKAGPSEHGYARKNDPPKMFNIFYNECHTHSIILK